MSLQVDLQKREMGIAMAPSSQAAYSMPPPPDRPRPTGGIGAARPLGGGSSGGGAPGGGGPLESLGQRASVQFNTGPGGGNVFVL